MDAETIRRAHAPTLAERIEDLESAAERLEQDAKRLEGTCWMGDMSPSQAARREASEKREHAMLLRMYGKNK